MIYGHGDDLYQYGNKVKMNFSSNIFTHADLSQLKMHLAMRLDVISNYPEPEPITLERLLAEQLGIQPQQVRRGRDHQHVGQRRQEREHPDRPGPQ